MDSDEFNQFRSETLWPEIVEHFANADTSGRSEGSDERGIETVPDYLQEVVDDVSNEVASWCEEHSEALHIFTRYYPFSEQPVTILLSNPKLDYDEKPTPEAGFPTLEHRRYAATNPNDIETLARISAEHYNSYLFDREDRECLLKRLGAVTDTLDISTVVDSPPEEYQWDADRESDRKKIGSNDERWADYFYNPDTTEGMEIADTAQTNPPHPREVLTNTTGVTGEDRGLSAQAPDLNTGFYNDFYITNLYKMGSENWEKIPTDGDDHIDITTREVENAASSLVIASGKPAQNVLIELGEPVYEPSQGKYSEPTTASSSNYGVVWKLNSGRYGLAVPHLSLFGAGLGIAFDGKSPEGWRLLSDALHYIGSETNL